MGNHQREEQLRAFLAEYPADTRRGFDVEGSDRGLIRGDDVHHLKRLEPFRGVISCFCAQDLRRKVCEMEQARASAMVNDFRESRASSIRGAPGQGLQQVAGSCTAGTFHIAPHPFEVAHGPLQVMGSSSFVAATQLHDLAMELEEAARTESVRWVVWPSRLGNRPGNRLHL